MTLKHPILCVLFLLLGSFSNEETLSWNEGHKLTWNDFKGQPDAGSDAVALTASGITFGYSLKTSDKQIVDFSTTVEAHFYPNESWHKKEQSTAHILKHEQLHFDITELYVRKFRAALTRLFITQNLKAEFNKLQNSINTELDKTQKRYDAESKHSIDVAGQEKWENYVLEELEKLDKYKS